MDIRPPQQVMAWLGPLLIVNVFIWIIVCVPQANAAICANSDNCLTDWVGALGGWAAVGAAFLTINAMGAQRKQDWDLHRRTELLSLIPKLKVLTEAENALHLDLRTCEWLEHSAHRFRLEVEELVRNPPAPAEPDLVARVLAEPGFTRDLDAFRKSLQAEVYLQVMSEIYVRNPGHYYEAKDWLRKYDERMATQEAPGARARPVDVRYYAALDLVSAVRAFKDFLTQLRIEIAAFRDKWESAFPPD